MARGRDKNSRLVYSTDTGRVNPQHHHALSAGMPEGDGIVRIRRETKGRGGKAVTVISGIPLAADDLKVLAKALKKKCGVGGSIKGHEIEIQGDQRETIKEELEKRDFQVKFSGG